MILTVFATCTANFQFTIEVDQEEYNQKKGTEVFNDFLEEEMMLVLGDGLVELCPDEGTTAIHKIVESPSEEESP